MFAHQVSSTGNVLNSNISLWKEKFTWPPDFHSQPFVFFLLSTLHITGVYYQSVNETSALNYNNSKPQQLSTYALTLFQYKTRVDGTDVRVDFWDTAGQERFSSMHPSYYHQAHSCLLVFDITRKVTYKNLAKWYKELREYRENIPCIVIANKIDVDYTMTQKSFNFPKKHGLPFYFVSASDGTNVVKAFREAIKLAVKYKENSTDFMDEVLRELENFDEMNLNQDGYDSSDKKSSEDEGKT